MIESIVNRISEYGMEDAAIFVLSALYPVSSIFSATTLLPITPFLELLGINSFEYAALLYDKENVKCILDRLNEIREGRNAS